MLNLWCQGLYVICQASDVRKSCEGLKLLSCLTSGLKGCIYAREEYVNILYRKLNFAA